MDIEPLMNINLRRSLITWLGLFIPLENLFHTTNVGFLFSKDITHNTVSVSAETHPGLILWALVALFLFWILQRKEEKIGDFEVVSLWRRGWAFCLDFVFFLVPTSVMLALVPVLLESQRLGYFQWQFERNYSVSTDWLIWPLLLLMLVLMILYFAFPLTRGKSSVGPYLLHVVVTKNGKPVQLSWAQALKRTLWKLLGFCIWPYTLIKGKDAEGRTWYDRKSGYQVLRYPKATASDKDIHAVWYFVIGLLVCGMAYCYSRYLEPNFEKTQWRVYTFDEYHFSMESPLPLPKDKQDYENDQVSAKVIKAMNIQKDSENLGLTVSSTEYKDKIVLDNMDAIYSNFINQFQSDSAVKDFQPKMQKITFQGMPAMMVTGTYNLPGSDSYHVEPMRLNLLVVFNGNWDWVLNVRCDDKAEDTAQANRIIQSFKISKF